MKVKVDSCVYDVNYIDIDKMSVGYTVTNYIPVTYNSRIELKTSINLDECELLSENSIDVLAIEHVKSIQRKKLEEKHTWDVGDGYEESDVVTVEIVGSVGDMNFMSDGTISQKATNSKNTEDDVVNNPKHYQIGLGEYEMKDVSYALINHNKLDGREGAVYFNILKYVGRFNNKGVPVQDLEKAEFYLKELIELTKEKDY